MRKEIYRNLFSLLLLSVCFLLSLQIKSIMTENIQEPGLFGQKHSNRDYTKEKTWGKNQFNSSFPASLIAYMHSKGIEPVYICLDKKQNIIHKYIDGKTLFGIDHLSDDLYYGFESNYFPFNRYYTGKSERIDLVLSNLSTNEALRGFEVKLTALPDNTTKDLEENHYSCEIVVRPPTICFVACSICRQYSTEKSKQKLRNLLSGVPYITHWEMIDEVVPHYETIRESVIRVMADMTNHQSPFIIQPVWKTNGKNLRLTDDCLDAFIWSDIAVIKMCIDNPYSNKDINRFQRTIIWIYKMLFDYVTFGQFDYITIIKNQSYGTANDKAFSLPGTRSFEFLKSRELEHPRIHKNESQNMILGGGQNFLSPERRFDAMIVNTPDLFDEEL